MSAFPRTPPTIRDLPFFAKLITEENQLFYEQLQLFPN